MDAIGLTKPAFEMLQIMVLNERVFAGAAIKLRERGDLFRRAASRDRLW